ncbi:MAG: ATP-binding protein [Actinomycetota bacterium]
MTRTRAHDFALALRHYLAGAEEAARLQAYEVARDAMSGGAGLLDVMADYQEAMAIMLSGVWKPEESMRVVNASAELLAESLGPFEMAHRGFQEANARLLQVNQDLERQIAGRQQAEEAARLAREEAERANRAKSEFLSRMSHELRTPFNAVLGFAQLLEMDDLSANQRESVQQIIKAGRHLLDLINEVLDISRIESGTLTLSLEPVEVAGLARETLSLVQGMATKRGVELRAQIAEDLEIYAMADRQRLRQVLLNLLSNAVKYNREKGAASLMCREGQEGLVCIEVTDTGPGIARERIDRLFNAFDRLGAEQSDIEGTGLGLVLSRRLVEAMGGKIGLGATSERGTTFFLELRRTEAPVDDRGPPEKLVPSSGQPAESRVILYIEDNLPNLRLVERVLDHRPEVKILSALQGNLGLELAREHLPSLVLLDLNLPDVSGEEVLRRLHEAPETEGIPVVVISADATPRQEKRLLAAGAREYLTKPLDVHRFLKVVDKILGAPD